jgi:hypothetical protein
MQSRKVSYLRGRRLRATRLDINGRPIYGDNAAVVTKGFITFGMTTNMEEGEAITVTDANGDSCVNEAAVPTFTGISGEAEFCAVDFALFEMLTGMPVVLDENGRAIGITETTRINLADINVALELWLGASSDDAPSTGSEGQFGYILLPFVGGGVIGDITIENAGITFTISNLSTKNGSNWGAGPYNVELVDGAPAPLSTPIQSGDHRRIQHVEVAPPTVYAGSIPLLDPTDPALTGVTATATGLSVALAPQPAGTDPVFYDFGDGSWDLAETGSYTHVYSAAGTYTITARRGSSTVTTTVTVTAA